jgi:hypothetical protein
VKTYRNTKRLVFAVLSTLLLISNLTKAAAYFDPLSLSKDKHLKATECIAYGRSDGRAQLARDRYPRLFTIKPRNSNRPAMSDKLKAAEAMAKAVRESWNAADHENFWEKFQVVVEALSAYEAAPAESQAAEGDATKEELAFVRRMQHFYCDNIVDGCPTGDWHIESTPAQAVSILRTLLAAEKLADRVRLASAQARIAELTEFNEYVTEKLTTHAEAVGVSPDHFDYIDETTKAIVAMWAKNSEQLARVAVLEKALDDIIQKCGEDYDERDPFDDIQRIVLAAQPSRENKV